MEFNLMKAVKLVEDPANFKLLADDTRRRIVFLLRAKEMNVSQIASNLELTPQAIYHHIKKLLDADLVTIEREERVGHLIESYYRATAEAFLCTVGVTPSGRDFFEKQMKTTLEYLVKIGFDLKFNDDDVELLIDKQDEMLKCYENSNFDENIKDSIGEIDNSTYSLIKEYGSLLSMTDEEFIKRQKLTKEFRDALQGLLR
jgi:DNA-binding transcriptional ArsR family regulator